MNTCPQCLNETNSTHCVYCVIQIGKPDPSQFPPVTWEEIRDEVIRVLMIEEEWLVVSDDSLIWWPGIIPQKVYVSSRIEIPVDNVSETLVRVTIESELGKATDREKALALVADLMPDFPFGSLVVLDDNTILAVSSVAIYSYSRGLIRLITEEALVQATFVQGLASELEKEGVVTLHPPVHPESGSREELDELIQNIYGNDIFTPISENLMPTRNLVRDYWQNAILSQKVELGFQNDEVTFVTYADRFDCGVGWQDETPVADKFGQSLMVWNNLAQTKKPLSLEDMNSLNLSIAFEYEQGIGHLGGVTQQQHEDFNSIQCISVLPYYFLQQSPKHGIESSIMNGFNAILQASASASYVFGLLNPDVDSKAGH